MADQNPKHPAEVLAAELRPTIPCDVLKLWAGDAADMLRRIPALEAERDALKETLHDELAENLALRELGGAGPDEGMTQFLRRVIAERDRLLAEVEAMHRDAERYRWLRDCADSFEWARIGAVVHPDGIDWNVDEHMRDAIAATETKEPK